MPDHLRFYENAGSFEQAQPYMLQCKKFKRVTYFWSDSSHSFFTCQIKIFKVREKVRESLEYHPFIRIFWHSGYILRYRNKAFQQFHLSISKSMSSADGRIKSASAFGILKRNL